MMKFGSVAWAAALGVLLTGCGTAPELGFDEPNTVADVQTSAADTGSAAEAGQADMVEAAAAPSGNAGALSLTYAGTGAGGVYLRCDYGRGAFTPANKMGSLTATAGGPAVTARPPAGGRIDWLDCGATGGASPELNLARNLDIVAGVPGTHSIVLAGGPTRALNVLLYPYLPTDPGQGLLPMQALYAEYFASVGDPSVMYNIVINTTGDYDIYTPANYPDLYGAIGFDVIEADMVMLADLITGNYVRPITGLTASDYWPGALEAASLSTSTGAHVWGVPHWMCTDFVFGTDSRLDSVSTLAELRTYYSAIGPTDPELISDLTGSWTLFTLYINTYFDIYGYVHPALEAHIGGYDDPTAVAAFTPDAAVITNMLAYSEFCDSSGTNDCVNGVYHAAAAGYVPAKFGGGAGAFPTYAGFAEQSFYILSAAPAATTFYAVEAPYGPNNESVMFADAFTANAATCPAGGACAGDAQRFFSHANDTALLNAITYSQDLGPGAAPRRLLPASQAFWSQSGIASDHLYSAFRPAVSSAHGFPNWIASSDRDAMIAKICSALQAQRPSYDC